MCLGSGYVPSMLIPWAYRKRDEIVPGLWLGGHVCQPPGQEPYPCLIKPNEGFDLVVSLYHWPGQEGFFMPPRDVAHEYHRMEDADLDPDHHTRLDELAYQVAHEVDGGSKVLVRCQAGWNRSSLVTALALLKMGWTADEAITRIRKARGPYALVNSDFVRYLKEQAA